MEATAFIICSLSVFISYSVASPTHTIGIHPLDEKYYGTEVIKCKDGSKSFTRDRLNDNFCDCPDGTDEPGTSACPAGKFYCRNVGSTPRFLFSSRVNDHVCDCCDGSDEYDGSMICPNACIMGGFVYQRVNYQSTKSIHDSVGARKSESGPSDSMQKLQGLKVLVFIQVVLVLVFVAFRLFRRRKTRRRNSR